MEGRPLETQLGGILEAGAVLVPDLDDAEAPLRADGEAVDAVRRIRGGLTDHGGDGVGHEGLAGAVLRNAHAVGAAIDVLCVFPERGDGIPHQEEHAVRQRSR